MKINDKDKAAEEAFAARVTELESQSELAKQVAAKSTRPSGSAADAASIPINVRANRRPGHDGFRRGGRMWPSAVEGIDVLATERLIECLESEPMLRVKFLPRDFDATGLERCDLPETFFAKMPEVPSGASAADIAKIVAAAVTAAMAEARQTEQ